MGSNDQIELFCSCSSNGRLLYGIVLASRLCHIRSWVVILRLFVGGCGAIQYSFKMSSAFGAVDWEISAPWVPYLRSSACDLVLLMWSSPGEIYRIRSAWLAQMTDVFHPLASGNWSMRMISYAAVHVEVDPRMLRSFVALAAVETRCQFGRGHAV